MKTITFYITMCALLLANAIKAQTTEDSSAEKKPMVIDGKKVRITIDTKKKSEETKDTKIIIDGDTTILENEEKIVTIDSNGKNETKIVKKEKKRTYTRRINNDEEKKNPTKWLKIDWGFNFLANKGKLDMPNEYKDLELENGKGCEFNLRIYEQSINIMPHHLYFVYGVGVDWNNYRFRNNVDLMKNRDSLTYIINNNNNYKQNKLVSTYLTVPLMLKVRFDKDKKGEAFQIAAGPQLGYLLNSHTKQTWNNDGEQKKTTNGDYNLEEFRIGYSLYMGYNHINFYARYFPESAFKENRGPDVNTVCLGLAIGGF